MRLLSACSPNSHLFRSELGKHTDLMVRFDPVAKQYDEVALYFDRYKARCDCPCQCIALELLPTAPTGLLNLPRPFIKIVLLYWDYETSMLGAAMRFVFNLWRNHTILIPANRKAKARFLTKRFKNSRLATIETLEARFAFDATLVTNDFRALPIGVPDAQFSGQYPTSGILSATFDATLALTGNLDFVDFDSAPPSRIDFTGSGIINDLIFQDQYPITIDGIVNSQLDNGTLSVLSGSTFTVSVDFGGSTPLVRSGLLTPGTAGNFDPTSFSVNIPID